MTISEVTHTQRGCKVGDHTIPPRVGFAFVFTLIFSFLSRICVSKNAELRAQN